MLRKLFGIFWTIVVGKFTPEEKDKIAEFTQKAADFGMQNTTLLVREGMKGAGEGFAKELKNHDT